MHLLQTIASDAIIRHQPVEAGRRTGKDSKDGSYVSQTTYVHTSYYHFGQLISRNGKKRKNAPTKNRQHDNLHVGMLSSVLNSILSPVLVHMVVVGSLVILEFER